MQLSFFQIVGSNSKRDLSSAAVLEEQGFVLSFMILYLAHHDEKDLPISLSSIRGVFRGRFPTRICCVLLSLVAGGCPRETAPSIINSSLPT